MGSNANTITNFNQNAQQQQANQANPAQQQPAPSPISVNSKMSIADIALMQKDPATLTPDEKIRRKALETKTNLQQIEDQKAAAEQAAQEKDRKEGNQQKVVMHEVGSALKYANGHPAKLWFENAPTPGGIDVLLIIIFVFLLAIVPVDTKGNTRLYLMWLTLTGKTHLSYSDTGTTSATTAATTSTTAAPVQATTLAPVQTTTPLVTLPNFNDINLGITGMFGL
jgi:hypothetical protein